MWLDPEQIILIMLSSAKVFVTAFVPVTTPG